MLPRDSGGCRHRTAAFSDEAHLSSAGPWSNSSLGNCKVHSCRHDRKREDKGAKSRRPLRCERGYQAHADRRQRKDHDPCDDCTHVHGHEAARWRGNLVDARSRETTLRKLGDRAGSRDSNSGSNDRNARALWAAGLLRHGPVPMQEGMAFERSSRTWFPGLKARCCGLFFVQRRPQPVLIRNRPGSPDQVRGRAISIFGRLCRQKGDCGILCVFLTLIRWQSVRP